MRAGFIGAGKVGFSLGKYLKENGVEITAEEYETIMRFKDEK